MADKTIKVFPSSKLSETEYVPGVGPDGAEVPADKAEAMLEAGIAVKSKPKEPDAPAKESEE